MDALIGSTGYVGSSLLRQHPFEATYHSANIGGIRHGTFDTVVCAGARAQKWLINKNPAEDLASIEGLMAALDTIQCERFILISTVDVFSRPLQVNEATSPDEGALQPYGLHRLRLEQFVASRFKKHLVARLPGLVGPGLRKNVIFDFKNQNNLHLIDHRHVFQFYPMVNLWYDLETAMKAGLSLVHLAAQPLSVGEVAERCFGVDFRNALPAPTVRYDLQTCFASIYGRTGPYQYDGNEVLQAIRSYAQWESATLKPLGTPAP